MRCQAREHLPWAFFTASCHEGKHIIVDSDIIPFAMSWSFSDHIPQTKTLCDRCV